jgi:uncharacterized protein YqfA (UPF0365 family)
MSQPNPEQQQAMKQQQMMQMQLMQAQIEEMQAKVMKAQAEAQKAAAEAQAMPSLTQAKLIAALSNNLNEDNESKDFERRIRLAELAIKEEDIRSNERIALSQMQNKSEKVQ